MGVVHQEPADDDAERDDASDGHLVGRALRLATDTSGDAWAVFRIEDAGEAPDLRILYGNAAYWQLIGFASEAALGRSMTELAPRIDWTRGLAGLLRRTAVERADVHDREFRFTLQTGPNAGQERVFEISMTVNGDIIAAGFRDVTAAIHARDRQAADARRNDAVASFLAVAVDPSISRARLLDALAGVLATRIGQMCAILESVAGGPLTLAAVAGEPADMTEAIRTAYLGRPLDLIPETTVDLDSPETVFRPDVSAADRDALAGAIAERGLPPALAASLGGVVSAPIVSGGRLIGRIHLVRTADAPSFTDDDRAVVDALAAAAALVLDRRDAEARLAAAYLRFEAMFEQSPVPMLFISDDVRLNAAAADLFGRPADEVVRLAQEPTSPWIPADLADQWERLRDAFRRRERVTGMRFALLRPSGERREIQADGIPLSGTDGSPMGVLAVLTDLTEHEALEAQLRHSQKMEALGRLAGGIAHDFNNVLMAILGYAEFLAADIRTGQASADDADQVVSATRKAIEFTARLTTFSRREAAQRVPTRLDALVSDLLPLVRRLAPETIELDTSLEPVAPVLLDPLEFEQVVLNLVVNAVDAMPLGGRLTIETESVELDDSATHIGRAAGPYVLLAVSDTGVGMDEPTRERIFEPFYTTKGVGEGTGLGLSMVFGAVERAHGTIWVYSEPGHGSTFKVYLPPTTQDVPATAGIGAEAELLGGTETVLLLEDDPLVREFVQRGLAASGYEVIVADRPSRALGLAAELSFDILVTDVVMPEMTGDAVAERMRAARPDLPVVFMSGYTARALAFEVGPHDTLVHKPLTAARLARAVREALDRPRR